MRAGTDSGTEDRRLEDGECRPETGDRRTKTEASTGQLPLSKPEGFDEVNGVGGMWEA